jgi:NAD(P)-dependent dehydrogenase (short-subunit alcohol dehydrogenase family)
MSENRKLTGKVAMVFGGSRGIGAAAARRLAREGANVGLTYVSARDKAADTVTASPRFCSKASTSRCRSVKSGERIDLIIHHQQRSAPRIDVRKLRHGSRR